MEHTGVMNRRAGAKGRDGPVQIFVSYTPADERWATWIASELETAVYRTMFQARDFVPGINFIDFMDRGLSEATAVVAVLSRHYQTSRYGRMEWQAALRADPDNPSGKLIPIRVDDSPLEGLLATITYIDMVGVTDQNRARELLLSRIGHAMAGRAKRQEVSYPGRAKTIPGQVLAGQVLAVEEATSWNPPTAPHARRAPADTPAYPPALPHPARSRGAITLLHVPGPRFGRGLVAPGEFLSVRELQDR